MPKGTLKKIVAVVTTITCAVWLFGPGVAHGATVEELLKQIADLEKQLKALQAQLAEAQKAAAPVAYEGVPAGFTFEKNLRFGDRNDDVKYLQIILKAEGTDVYPEGLVTGYFGPLTKAAVIRFQEKYADEVLAEWGLTKGTGFVGKTTRAKLNALLAAAVAPVEEVVEVAPTAPTAALAPDTPAAATIPIKATKVPVLKVTLTAGTEDVSVYGMTFKRAGLGEAADWPTVYLYEDDARLTTVGRSISTDTQTVEFPALKITIPAGESKSFVLRANTRTSGGAGNQSYFQLIDIDASAAFEGLPISGHTMTIGTVGVSTATVVAGISPPNPAVGSEQAEIANIKITAGSHDVEVKQIILTFSGTMARTDVTNLKLYYLDELLAETAGVDRYDNAIFTLATPFTIPKSLSRTFTVKADLGGKVDETLTTKIEAGNDVLVVDAVYGYGAQISISAPLTVGSITLLGGTVTLADKGPLQGYVAKNTQDLVLTKVGMTANRDVEVRKLKIHLCGSSGITFGSDTISDLRIKDVDTGVTLATYALSGTLSTDCANPTVATLTEIFNLTKDVTRNIGITVDVGTASALDDIWVRADLAMAAYGATQVYIRDIETGDYLKAADIVPSSITGDKQTIVAAGLTPRLASLPTSQTVIRGAEDVEALGIVLDAARGSDITVRKLYARIYVNSASNFAVGSEVTTPNAVVTVVKLYDGTTLLGQKTLENKSVTGHDYGLARFDNLNISVGKGTTKKLVVKINTASDLDATRYASVEVQGSEIVAYDAEGSQLSISANVNALSAGTTPSRYVKIETQGTLTVSRAYASPLPAIVSVDGAGAITKDVPLLMVDFKAEKEAMEIYEMKVTIGSGTNYAGDTAYAAVKIYDGTTLIASDDIDYAGSVTTTFQNLAITVPKDSKKTLTFKADISGIDQAVTTGKKLQLKIISGVVKATGVSSKAQVTASGTATGYDHVVRYAKPTITLASLPTTTLQAGTNTLFKFTITPDKGDIGWAKLQFKVSGTVGSKTIGDDDATKDSTTAITAYDSAGTESVMISSLELWNVNTNTKVEAATTTVENLTGYAVIRFVPATTAGGSPVEQVVSPTAPITYELRGTVASVATGDAVSTKIDSVASSFATFDLDDNDDTSVTAADIVGATGFEGGTPDGIAGSILWTDRSASSHGLTTSDWTNDYKVPGIPTFLQTLSR